jgi:hypothetical protein
MRYLSVALVALALVATVAGGSADAKKKKNPAVKSVSCTGTGQSTCSAVKTGSAVAITVNTPASTGTPTGGTGGSVQKFDANLTAGQTKSVTSGNYVLSTTATGTGACGGLFLTNVSGLEVVAFDDSDDQAFGASAAVGSAPIGDADAIEYDQFVGLQTLPLGPSVAGQAFAGQVVAGACQVAGYIV